MLKLAALILIFIFALLFVEVNFEPNTEAKLVAQNTNTEIAPNTTTDLASCRFVRSDQGSNAALAFQSQKFLSYLYEASQKSTVPAGVLGGIARIESTTGEYSLSDYTDEDINYIENSNVIPDVVLNAGNSDYQISRIKSLRIPNTTKAVCPVSDNNALGIMQIQPPGTRGRADGAVEQGARYIGKSITDLTLRDYCNPRSSVLIAAGFILNKQGATSWDPNWNNDRSKIDAVARSYYGGLLYGDEDQYSYGADLWASLQACKNPSFSQSSQTSSGRITQLIKSNSLVTKVGNPTGPAPAGGTAPSGNTAKGPLGFSVSCPLGNEFKINCGTAANPVGNCGHGAPPPLYIECIQGVYAQCPFSEALKKSIDVVLPSGNAADALVYFPYVNGDQVVEWKKVSGPIPIPGPKGTFWGYKAEYTTSFEGKELKLDLTHIKNNVAGGGKSGEQVAAVYNGTDGTGRGHLHTLLYVDGKPVETAKEALICSN